MRTIAVLCFVFPVFGVHAVCAGYGETKRVHSGTMGVCIENEGKKLVLIYDSTYEKQLHTEIDLGRAQDLEYKTRIMRYFGGMLKNDTYHFESIQVIWGNEDFEMEFTRANVATIINSILAQIE